MLALTIAGLFIVSALIGVIAAGIDTKLAELRRGRSIVLEKEHTVILGWSDSIFTIIRELTLANESRHKPVIVILADMDKVEMEDELKAKVPDLRGTRVICRSGSPMDIDDLALSSHISARSVILLAPDSEDPDSEVIKTLLALDPRGRRGPEHRGGDPQPDQPRGGEAPTSRRRFGAACVSTTSRRACRSSSTRTTTSSRRSPSSAPRGGSGGS